MKPKKKDLDGIILNHIVMKLESEKANNSGKLPYGAITQIVVRMRPHLPSLTKDKIKYHLRRLVHDSSKFEMASQQGSGSSSRDNNNKKTRQARHRSYSAPYLYTKLF
jgi:hypothetical protein